MSIKNRLKKLQIQIIGNDSEFCGCKKELKTIVIVPSPDGGKMTLDGKPYIKPSCEETPEFCERCRKPIEKQVIIVRGVKSSIPKPEGAR